MVKHHTKRGHSNKQEGGAMSIEPETPRLIQEKIACSLKEGWHPSYEEIQQRAYYIHEQKGGSEIDNWLEAERLLKQERTKDPQNRCP